MSSGVTLNEPGNPRTDSQKTLEMEQSSIDALREEIAAAERRLEQLKAQLRESEQIVSETLQPDEAPLVKESNGTNGMSQSHGMSRDDTCGDRPGLHNSHPNTHWPLSSEEYIRYGRQLIMPQVGLPGQVQLKKSKVLIVGLGGLGCPAAAYLAGAGVGTLGLIDGDTVDLSNLHRQVAHSTERMGMSKIESAYRYLKGLNPNVNYNRYPTHLSPEQAIPLFQQYDLVLDCTDHPTSRYLISDACVLTGRPLVSASALKTDGQLIVLNDPPREPGDLTGGPCYRCIFPKPPPADSVLSCGEGGILGPVVGVMGVLQALEAIKLICARSTASGKDCIPSDPTPEQQPTPTMLMVSAFPTLAFRSVRLRTRRKTCTVCSTTPSITAHSLSSGSLDYIAFCGVTHPVNVLSAQSRISAKDFAELAEKDRGTIIDVRDTTQFAICALPGSVNVPWTGDGVSWVDLATQAGVIQDEGRAQYVVCRVGNDSQLAAQALIERASGTAEIKDIRGGLQAWHDEVDPEWPVY